MAGDRLFNLSIVDPTQVPDPLTDVADVSALGRRGDQWAVVDAQNWAAPFPDSKLDLATKGPPPVVVQLLRCSTPAASFDDHTGWSAYFFLENADAQHRSYDEALEWLQAGTKATGGRILVFDVTKSRSTC